jgi:hypothetical protein
MSNLIFSAWFQRFYEPCEKVKDNRKLGLNMSSFYFHFEEWLIYVEALFYIHT